MKFKTVRAGIVHIVSTAYGTMGAEVAFALLDWLATREAQSPQEKAQLRADVEDYIRRIQVLDGEIAEDQRRRA